MNKPNAARLREIFSYEPSTGELRRLDRGGALAGSVGKNGYRQMSARGTRLYAHRLAWAIFHGEWPTGEIDHIDGDRTNNRIANLRVATHAENARNRGLQSDNTSGAKGVTYDRLAKSWKAQIKVDGRNIHIGRFKNIEEAKAAYAEAAGQHHGSFARAA